MWHLALLTLWGCNPPEDDLSRVEELQVLSVQGQPPEVGPGEVLTVRVDMMDPRAAGMDLLVWFCTDLGEGCAEAGTPGNELGAWTAVVRNAQRTELLSFVVPPEVGFVLGGNVRVSTFVAWAMACAPDVCEVMDQVEDAPRPGTPLWQTVTDRLADPRGLVLGTSIDEVSLSYRRLAVSIREDLERNKNPVFTYLGPTPLRVAPGTARALSFEVDDASRAWAYSTVGGFGSPTYGVGLGSLEATWTAPEEEGAASVLVLFEDGAGGVAVWRTDVEVAAED